jgi:hypothetical protein
MIIMNYFEYLTSRPKVTDIISRINNKNKVSLKCCYDTQFQKNEKIKMKIINYQAKFNFEIQILLKLLF